jgi:hypothetical protein
MASSLQHPGTGCKHFHDGFVTLMTALAGVDQKSRNSRGGLRRRLRGGGIDEGTPRMGPVKDACGLRVPPRPVPPTSETARADRAIGENRARSIGISA